MEKCRTHTHTAYAVFSRWSRKAYAAFASLGRVVHIGHLDALMCDTAMGKQPAGICHILKQPCADTEQQPPQAPDVEEEACLSLFGMPGQLLLALLVVITSPQVSRRSSQHLVAFKATQLAPTILFLSSVFYSQLFGKIILPTVPPRCIAGGYVIPSISHAKHFIYHG